MGHQQFFPCAPLHLDRARTYNPGSVILALVLDTHRLSVPIQANLLPAHELELYQYNLIVNWQQIGLNGHTCTGRLTISSLS